MIIRKLEVNGFLGWWNSCGVPSTRTVDLPGTTQSETVMINMNVTNSYAYGGRAMCFLWVSYNQIAVNSPSLLATFGAAQLSVPPVALSYRQAVTPATEVSSVSNPPTFLV